MLKHGHLTIHTWPEANACAIDLYSRNEDSVDKIKEIEEFLCDWLGWENCTSTILLGRGKYNRVMVNDEPTSS